jgi:hypothetical protein
MLGPLRWVMKINPGRGLFFIVYFHGTGYGEFRRAGSRFGYYEKRHPQRKKKWAAVSYEDSENFQKIPRRAEFW